MRPKGAVEAAIELIESDYQAVGLNGYVAVELQDGVVMVAEMDISTRPSPDVEVRTESDFDITPIWGAGKDD